MRKHLKQLANNLTIVALSTFFIISSVNAKEIPITQEAELTIPVGEFSVIEFPFKITSKNITSFMTSMQTSEESNIVVEDKVLEAPIINKDITVKEEQPQQTQQKPKKIAKSTDDGISIVQNINSFTLFPKKTGVIKLVVWGYDHPILLSIKAVAKEGSSLYKFILPQSKSTEIAGIEQNTHEQVINTLMVHLFNQTSPKGYKNSSRNESYTSNGFKLDLNRELLGNNYIAQEWLMTNSNNKEVTIHEESFYQKGIYAVALEADTIKNKESIRVFIVRQSSKERE